MEVKEIIEIAIPLTVLAIGVGIFVVAAGAALYAAMGE